MPNLCEAMPRPSKAATRVGQADSRTTSIGEIEIALRIRFAGGSAAIISWTASTIARAAAWCRRSTDVSGGST